MPGTLTRPELTATDRCDRCGAAAKLRAVLPSGGELLFCGHHARAYEAGLREVRLIHGRGKGVQRGIVQHALERHARVSAFYDAPDAHLGATIAVLGE